MIDGKKVKPVVMDFGRLEVFEKLSLFALALSALWFLTLPSIGDNGFHWFMGKILLFSFVVTPVFFLFHLIFLLLPKNSTGAYVRFYSDLLSSTEQHIGVTDTQRKKLAEHFHFLQTVGENIDKTPEDIRKLEKKVRSSERTIRAIESGSAAAIGYGVGKKTGPKR